MFERFNSQFRRDAALSGAGDGGLAERCEPPLRELFHRFEGASFNDGLYRVMSADTFKAAHVLVSQGFHEFAYRITAFAFDWLGRVFALDSSRLEEGLPGVVMFEPGTGQALEIPSNLATFHERELIDFSDAALAARFHAEWLASGGAAPKHSQCVGYKKPLFLAGKDELSNLALSDLDVYWALSGQILQQTRGLLPGTRVKRTHIGD